MDLSLLAIVLPLAVALAITTARSSRGDSWMLVSTLCLVVVWLRVDSRFEGPVLVRVIPNHGLVVADLFGLTVAALAVAVWASARRKRVAALTSR